MDTELKEALGVAISAIEKAKAVADACNEDRTASVLEAFARTLRNDIKIKENPIRYAMNGRGRIIKVTDNHWEPEWRESTKEEYLEMESFTKRQVARGTF